MRFDSTYFSGSSTGSMVGPRSNEMKLDGERSCDGLD